MVAPRVLLETLGSRESIEREVRRFVCCGTESPCRPYAPLRMTQESCRPRVSDRTMVGNSATRLACEFQRTEWRRHVSERETTGTKKHPRLVAPRPRGPLRNGTKRSSRCRTNVATGVGGRMSKKYSCRSGGEECFLLDIPFNRTSRPSDLTSPRQG